MARLVLISSKRSGTNYFQDVVGQTPGVLAVREVFNPRGVFGLNTRNGIALNHLRQELADDDLQENSPDLMGWVHEDPVRALSALERCAQSNGLEWLSFTLFDDQLTNEWTTSILRQPDTHAVFLARAHLPRYVSLLKAQSVDVWKRKDTTRLRPKVDIDRFIDEAQKTDIWFNEARKAIEGPEHSTVAALSYDADVRPGAQPLLSKLRRSIPSFPKLEPDRPYKTTFFKQDRNADVFDAVHSGSRLREDLKQKGLLQFAFKEPLLDELIV